MPSQVVDDAWHEFILSTRIYGDFCRRAFGYFLHHTPAEAMATPTFAIDGLLNIPGGFTYRLHCDRDTSGIGSGVYCASHIGCSSGCAGDWGMLPTVPAAAAMAVAAEAAVAVTKKLTPDLSMRGV